MAKLYIDTNVIIDAVEGRRNKFKKHIGNPASDLFLEAIKCKHNIIISTWTLLELSGLGKISSAKMFFEMTKKKIIMATYSEEDMIQANKKSFKNPDDALHMIIAEREKSDIIVTRNVEHFEEIGTTIPIQKPEELL